MEKNKYIRLFDITNNKLIYIPFLEFVSNYNISSFTDVQIEDIFKKDILYLTEIELAKLEGRYHD